MKKNNGSKKNGNVNGSVYSVPTDELFRAWEQKLYDLELEPTLENTSVYVTAPDGEYFFFGDLCIKVSEHFADNGKDMKSLITDVIQYSARNTNNDDELAG